MVRCLIDGIGDGAVRYGESERRSGKASGGLQALWLERPEKLRSHARRNDAGVVTRWLGVRDRVAFLLVPTPPHSVLCSVRRKREPHRQYTTRLLQDTRSSTRTATPSNRNAMWSPRVELVTRLCSSSKLATSIGTSPSRKHVTVMNATMEPRSNRPPPVSAIFGIDEPPL